MSERGSFDDDDVNVERAKKRHSLPVYTHWWLLPVVDRLWPGERCLMKYFHFI